MEEGQVHRLHAPHGLGKQFAPAEVRAVTRVFCARDVIGQSILVVVLESLRGLALAIDDVAAGDGPFALGGDGFLEGVLDLLDGGIPSLAINQFERPGGAAGDGERL